MTDFDRPVPSRDDDFVAEGDENNESHAGASAPDDYEARNKRSKLLLWVALALLALFVIVFGANAIANHMSMPHEGILNQMNAMGPLRQH